MFGPFVSIVREALAGYTVPKYGKGAQCLFCGLQVWYYDVGFLGGPGDPGKGCFPSRTAKWVISKPVKGVASQAN